MTQNEPLDDTLPIPGPASQEIGANNPPSAIEMARDQWKAINVFLTDHPAIVGEDDARQAKLFLDRGKAAIADLEAARTKGIVSPVAGQADILIVPDLEAGNMLAKQLVYLADADMAGIVLGARAPIILTSRADGTLSRLASCAIALLWARRPT